MNSIDRLSAQDAARTYVQNADATRTSGVAGRGQDADAKQPKVAPAVDSVSLSDTARSLAAAREAVQNAPDVREDKVGDIKQQITDGTYSVSASVLARKMLDAPAPAGDQSA
jgi:negative regulator of flagellin synthesis FlgM